VQGTGADRALEPAGGALGDDPAVVDDGDPVGEPVGLVQVLGGQQHRGPVGDDGPDDVFNVQAGVTAHVLDKRPDQARETLLVIEQTSARALGELRATLGMLRDAGDDRRAPTPGLNQVEELVGLAREAGLDVKLEVASPPVELPGTTDQAAYRILQESITNAIRHAGPARVVVSVTYGPSDLELLVVDDGHGPRDAGRGAGDAGRGIVGMRERAALLGGELTAGSGPGGGFRVRARLPLPPDGTARP
jgi:signal transduction histidine kinase